MAALRYIVNDIYTILEQTYDDSKIEFEHVLYHVLVIADRLKSQHIEKRDSGAFLHIYTDIQLTEDKTTINPDKIAGRKYIDIPHTIYDYDLDRGISYISYSSDADEFNPPFTSVTFCRTTPAKSKRLYWTDEEKPSPSNPYFYRVNNRIYTLGIECINNPRVEIGLYNSFNPDDYFKLIVDCDLDSEFDFPDELIAILQRQVLDLGRFALLIPKDSRNDGDSELKESNVPTQKLVSVNEQQQQ